MKIDFKIASNLIVACHITGIYDVNRSTTLANDDFSLVADWVNAITKQGLNGIIFHNNFSETTCKTHQNKQINFVKVDYNPSYNPNVFRYSVYNQFLNNYAKEIENIFFTDISDVTVLKNPFIQPLFTNNTNKIFCGDEPEVLENEWMQNHSKHLRSKISDYTNYENQFKSETLLNCGIFGGNISIIKPFVTQLWNIHEHYNADNNTLFTGDMGAFNYLVRTKYNHQLIHGQPVNTVFKSYTPDDLCWFMHK